VPGDSLIEGTIFKKSYNSYCSKLTKFKYGGLLSIRDENAAILFKKLEARDFNSSVVKYFSLFFRFFIFTFKFE
jgi:hypothetical protein